MTRSDWKPTACNLCYANCGILARVDEETGRVIEKVKGDKSHPVSKGYTCNKAARINYYQNGRDRLNAPLRRRDDGTFEKISWDTAISEIAGKLSGIRDEHGGDKILYNGGGGQGNHLGGAHASAVNAALGMRYHSNALAQEKTGLMWMNSRMLGGKPRSGGFVFGRIHPPTGSSIVIRDSTVEDTQLFGICERGNGCPSHIDQRCH